MHRNVKKKHLKHFYWFPGTNLQQWVCGRPEVMLMVGVWMRDLWQLLPWWRCQSRLQMAGVDHSWQSSPRLASTGGQGWQSQYSAGSPDLFIQFPLAPADSLKDGWCHHGITDGPVELLLALFNFLASKYFWHRKASQRSKIRALIQLNHKDLV